MFSGLQFFFLPTGIGKGRQKVLESQAEKNGGKILKKLELALEGGEDETGNKKIYVIVNDDVELEEICHSFSVETDDLIKVEKSVCLVRAQWISFCLKHKKHLPTSDFEVDLQNKKPEDSVGTYFSENRNFNTSQLDRKRRKDSSSDSEFGESGTDFKAMNYTVDAGSSNPAKKGHFICETSSSNASGRAVNYNKHITDKLEILAAGYKSTNDKWRAYTYGKAVDRIKRYPKAITSRNEVAGMKGIGSRLADKVWEICQSGELRKADAFAQDQKIQTMNLLTNIWGVGPTIAEQWYVQVVDTACELREGLICQACGSYRRGKETCGDVDILLTHPDGKSHEGVIGILVKKLTETGFLTDHLVESHEDGDQKKYMGVCILPGNNRTAGEKLNDGYLIPTPTEQSVFEALGIPYRTPEQRDHD